MSLLCANSWCADEAAAALPPQTHSWRRPCPGRFVRCRRGGNSRGLPRRRTGPVSKRGAACPQMGYRIRQTDQVQSVMSEPIFTNWSPEHTKAWGNAPLRLKHRLPFRGRIPGPKTNDLALRFQRSPPWYAIQPHDTTVLTGHWPLATGRWPSCRSQVTSHNPSQDGLPIRLRLAT